MRIYICRVDDTPVGTVGCTSDDRLEVHLAGALEAPAEALPLPTVDVRPNYCVSVALGTTLTPLRTYATWLIVWSAEGRTVSIANGDLAEGGALPSAARPIPPNTMPFAIDVSTYGGTVFVAASAACNVVFEGRD